MQSFISKLKTIFWVFFNNFYWFSCNLIMIYIPDWCHTSELTEIQGFDQFSDIPFVIIPNAAGSPNWPESERIQLCRTLSFDNDRDDPPITTLVFAIVALHAILELSLTEGALRESFATHKYYHSANIHSSDDVVLNRHAGDEIGQVEENFVVSACQRLMENLLYKILIFISKWKEYIIFKSCRFRYDERHIRSNDLCWPLVGGGGSQGRRGITFLWQRISRARISTVNSTNPMVPAMAPPTSEDGKTSKTSGSQLSVTLSSVTKGKLITITHSGSIAS